MLTAARTDTGLLRAILADPADDAPRLVYADWLEQDRRGPGDEELAEFIRLQCELARLSGPAGHPKTTPLAWSCKCGPCEAAKPLRRRERELWGYLPRRDGMLRQLSDSLPEFAVLLDEQDSGSGLTHDYPWAFVRRGFVESVTCTTAAFVGGPCERCEGRGKFPGRWVNTNLGRIRSGISQDCSACSGTGRVPGIARTLALAQPITAVTLSDREPWEDTINGGFRWNRHTIAFDHHLPRCIFDLLVPHPDYVMVDDRIWKATRSKPSTYPTRAAALDALSRACVQWGREQAGLTTMKETKR